MRRLLLGMFLATACVTSVSASGVPTPPESLTGTWAGEMKCKGTSYSTPVQSTLEGYLYVVQAGTELVLASELFLGGPAPSVTPQGVGIYGSMCGVVFRKKPTVATAAVGTFSPLGAPGVLSFVDENELQVVAIKTKTFAENSNGESGKLSGKGVLLPRPTIGTCRWKFTRISTTPPPLSTGFCTPQNS